jgi:hypothetical protein
LGRFVGVVQVPGLFEAAGANRKSVKLRAQPASDAPIAYVASEPIQLESAEYAYEESAAVVYERRNGWYRVGYVAGEERHPAWLAPQDAGTFQDNYELFRDRLAYLTASWDGRIYRLPEVGADPQVIRRADLGGDDRHVDIEIVRLERVGDAIWALVVVLGPGRCSAQHSPVVAAGFVPLFDSRDTLNIWFYSRGC